MALEESYLFSFLSFGTSVELGSGFCWQRKQKKGRILYDECYRVPGHIKNAERLQPTEEKEKDGLRLRGLYYNQKYGEANKGDDENRAIDK